jgi:membrane fusion protein, multidrug efflux system
MKEKKIGPATSFWMLSTAVAIGAAACGGSSVASNPIGASPNDPETPIAESRSVASEGSVRAAPGEEILSVLSVEHQVDVSTEMDGAVVALYKDEGSVVKAGDVLGQIDDRTLRLELIKAEDDLKVAQNNVKYKEAELKAKTAAFERQKQLRQLGLSSQADLEAAEFGAKAAEYDLRGWEAQVESSQAEMSRIKLLIDKTQVRSPFAGVVARRYVREGQMVAKNDKCFRVSQLQPLLVQFQVSEVSGHRPELNNNLQVFLVEDPTQPILARIIKISPTVDPTSDSYNVTAQLKDSQAGKLRPGMAVRVVWPGIERAKH